MADAKNFLSHTLLKKMVKAELDSGLEQRFSYMIEGDHGIGKSSFIKELALENDGYLIDLRLGQRDLGDVLGMPQVIVQPNGDKRFFHIKPELIRKAFVKDLTQLGVMGDDDDVLGKLRSQDKLGKPYQYIFLFADEYNRGTKDVQQAMFELVYDRRMSGEKVNPKCWIFAACNDDLNIYTVTEGDPAFRSRFKTVKYKPTVDEWLAWGKQTGELCDEVIHVITTKKDLADPPAGKKTDIEFLNQPHPNRRSWHEFSKFYASHKQNFTALEMRDIGATFIGGDTAEIFKTLVERMTQTQTNRKKSEKKESGKASEVFENFFRTRQWDNVQLKTFLDALEISELEAVTDSVADGVSHFKYVTGIVKDRFASFAEILYTQKPELWTALWNKVDDQWGFKNKIREYVAQTKPSLNSIFA